MGIISYSQNFEDAMLWRALSTIEEGFYIDVGAWDPDEDSVTRAFYDHGWQGVNVEPVATYFERLSARRPRDVNLKVALGRSPGVSPFFEIAGTGLSTLDAKTAARHRAAGRTVVEVIVEVTTLADVCRRHAPADTHFLKIDVEQAERAVLAGADFATFRPWIVLVEATEPNSEIPSHADWESILLQADYGFVWFDGVNRFYVAAEHHDRFAPHFRTPVNAFDDIRLAKTVRLENENATLSAAISDLEQGVAGRDLKRLNRLLLELRMEDGPRALRLVLPVARCIRALHLLFGGATGEAAAPVANGGQQPGAAAPAAPLPPRRPAWRRLAKAVAWPLYRLVRPLPRPLAWRLRAFRTREILAASGGTDSSIPTAIPTPWCYRPAAKASTSRRQRRWPQAFR
jgi:FkbM family methyltransferase